MLRFESRGFSLLEVMVAVGALGIVTLGVLSISNISLKTSTSANVYHQADQLRKYIQSVVRNKNAWTATVGANPSLACLLDPPGTADCSAYNNPAFAGTSAGDPVGTGAKRPFAVVDQNGIVVYDPTSPTRGFTQAGAPCNEFGVTPYAPNNRCPLRLELSWRVQCPTSGACTVANGLSVEVEGYVLYRPLVDVNTRQKEFPFRPANYGFKTKVNEEIPAEADIGDGLDHFLTKWKVSEDDKLVDSRVYQNGSDIVVNVGPTETAAKPAYGSLTLYQDTNDGTDGFAIKPSGGGYDGTGADTMRFYNAGDGYGHLIFDNNVRPMTWHRQGNVGIGTATPTEKLEVAGGNVKMGYEQRSTSCAGATLCTATCSAGKYLLGGGCWLTVGWANLQHGPAGVSSYRCMSSLGTAPVLVTAICANIR